MDNRSNGSGEGQIWIWIEMGKAVRGSREDRTEGE